MGWTTSGCHSPALGAGLAMASLPVSEQYLQYIYIISTQYLNTIYTISTHYVQVSLAQAGTEVAVMLAGEERAATVLPGPPASTQPTREKRGTSGL